MNRREFMAGCGLSAAAAAATLSAAEKEKSTKALKHIANPCGIDVGVQTSMKQLEDSEQAAFILKNFDLIAAGNEFKWNYIHPSPGSYNFTKADWVVNYTQEHKLLFHGHNLCWQVYNPDWLVKTVNKSNAEKLLSDHVTTVMKRYAGKVSSWDVVNEPVSEAGPNGMYNGPWLKALGPEYIDVAFHAAQAADPAALRVLNIHHVEQDSKQDEGCRAAAVSLLKSLMQRKVPVQAVGFESHLDGDLPARSEGCVSLVKQIRDMGLKVIITELDVNDSKIPDDPGRPGDPASRDKRVASIYQEYLLEMVQAGSINRVIFFAISDAGNWYDGMTAPQYTRADPQTKHRPSLLDANMQAKPAFSSVQSAFSKLCSGT